ncbi:MAG: hypothetical protein OEZ59_03255 [Deltaproteobacteria bacterium]|nr:hypothetical protein [Deltaproteobacteria bacterium]
MKESFFKKLMCMHRQWHRESDTNHLRMGKTRYVCNSCGKVKYFDTWDQPLNFPVDKAG